MSVDVRPVRRTITQAQLGAYADASGDHNPIHIDEAFAAGTPFGGTIAHGMLVLALIGEMMFGAFGARWSASGRLKVRFKAPARPGDAITASAEVSGEAGGRLEYAVRCETVRGETLIEGRASVEAA
ncbi:MAG: MaoC family dehydratase [Dehalococcoidia bacterium]